MMLVKTDKENHGYFTLENGYEIDIDLQINK